MVEKADQTVLYQIRAEELDKNYFSLREIEWRVSLEVLSGYVGIALAHYALNAPGRPEGQAFLRSAGIVLPLVLFTIYACFSVCIQQRLHYTRDRKNQYIDKLHDAYGVPRLPEEQHPPRFGNWYAYLTQMAIHFAAVSAIIAYVIKST